MQRGDDNVISFCNDANRVIANCVIADCVIANRVTANCVIAKYCIGSFLCFAIGYNRKQTETDMEQLLQVGILSSTHGVRGEMKVFPTTDDVNRFKKKKEYILETPKGNLPVKVSSVKFFKQFVILKFEGFDTLDDIAPYKGCRLLVDREHAVACEKDEYFIADLIGMKVIADTGDVIGTLTDVMQTGANDVYVVTTDEQKEVLLPAIRECVLAVDMDRCEVKVHIMPGLLEG